MRYIFCLFFISYFSFSQIDQIGSVDTDNFPLIEVKFNERNPETLTLEKN